MMMSNPVFFYIASDKKAGVSRMNEVDEMKSR